MKKFKIQNVSIQPMSRECQRDIKGGCFELNGCTVFYTRPPNAQDGDPCECAVNFTSGTIRGGLCCIDL